MNKSLNTPLQYLPGIGPKRAKSLKRLGLETIEDFLYYFPRRYEDRTNFTPIAQLKEGLNHTIRAKVLRIHQRQSFKRRGFTITEAIVQDNSGSISCTWFNQPYLKEYILPGIDLILFGKIERFGKKLQINAPEFEIIKDDGYSHLDVDRLVPIYTIPENMSQRHFRRLIKKALDEYLGLVKEFLPYTIRQSQGLLNLPKALLNIHFPESKDERSDAYRRLSFDEFFLFQIPLALRKRKRKEKIGIQHNLEGRLALDFENNLPFSLTLSQKQVLLEITKDMSSVQPMQRLLQGDVGCGKTVVSVIAALIAIQNKYQVAFMVPTEILAKQHYEKIRSQLSGVRCQEKEIKIALITGSTKGKEKDKLCQDIKKGEIDLVIGTHSLIESNIEFSNLGLVIIDEQHKFGVGQRALLPKKGKNPDVLIMTATPIPRTLAITIYGDLDISVINEMPKGRKQINTLYFNEAQKKDAFEIMRQEVLKGRQGYIVYPVIEESAVLDLSGAKKMYADLKSKEFKDFRLGLIHGKMKDLEQEKEMNNFRDKKIDILVSTTILEVGIDIANASVMLIENCERFGLSQLHQLRGRVGRGAFDSYCLLFGDIKTEEAESRINALVKYNDGFRISEEDLRIRGPGEFFGRRQHGLSELRIANPLLQMQLLKRAREEAIKLVESDPNFTERSSLIIKERLLKVFPEYEKLIMVG